MNLSPHFTLAEFTDSDTAKRFNIDNSIPPDLLFTAGETAQMLENIREFLGHPITVTSAYRSPALNRAIGSSDTSDHIKAMAVDFKCPEFGSPYDVCYALRGHIDGLMIGQLIHEFGSWIHVSTRVPSKVVNRVITIDASGTRLGIKK